jgi:uncharacterized protein YndB with AHSA1/START domain
LRLSVNCIAPGFEVKISLARLDSMKTIRIFQPLRARPARVFRALSDATELSAWQADVVRGRVATGRTLSLEWPKLGVALELEVRAVEPARRVLLTNGLANVELTVQGGGLELCHTAPMDDDERAGTESSWRIALATLSTYLARHGDKTRRVHWAKARVRGSPELCHAYFSDAQLLRGWLGVTDSNIGPSGSVVHLQLESGRRARGPVIAHTTGRDLAFRWQELDDSVLVMRTLPDPEPEKRAVLLGWSRWSELPDASAVVRELDTAVERLARRLESLAYA